jgi:hypothetical protein
MSRHRRKNLRAAQRENAGLYALRFRSTVHLRRNSGSSPSLHFESGSVKSTTTGRWSDR